MRFLGELLPLRASLSRRLAPLQIIETELRTNTGWIRVHAADALLDHGKALVVLETLGARKLEVPTTFRVGIWRALARAECQVKGSTQQTDKLVEVLRDASAPDRLQAAESLAKLGYALGSRKSVVEAWLREAPEAMTPYLYWLLLLDSEGAQKAACEQSMAALLDSSDAITGLRAAYALGRCKDITPDTLTRLRRRAQPGVSPALARPYIFSALLRHTAAPEEARKLREELAVYLRTGTPDEQLEVATVLGLRGAVEERPLLEGLLRNENADTRIGAASGLLYLMR